jgi:hypothetical protein
MGNFLLLCKIEVFTAVVMKSPVFCDITLCSLLKINMFQRNMSPPSSGLKINYLLSRKQVVASCWFVAWLILQPWRWRCHVPPKCWLIFNILHGEKKIELFKLSPSHKGLCYVELIIYMKHFTDTNNIHYLNKTTARPIGCVGPS